MREALVRRRGHSLSSWRTRNDTRQQRLVHKRVSRRDANWLTTRTVVGLPQFEPAAPSPPDRCGVYESVAVDTVQSRFVRDSPT